MWFRTSAKLIEIKMNSLKLVTKDFQNVCCEKNDKDQVFCKDTHFESDT